jgi:prevent-host-death family protein
MKKARLEKVQARLGDYVAASAKDPVLIIQNGEPVAMLVGLRHKNHQTPIKLRELLKRAWKDYDQNGGIPHEEFWKVVMKEGKARDLEDHE